MDLHLIGWMIEAGGGIKLIVGVAKTKLPEEMPRSSIAWIVSGEQAPYLELVKGIFDNSGSGLAGITTPPLG